MAARMSAAAADASCADLQGMGRNPRGEAVSAGGGVSIDLPRNFERSWAGGDAAKEEEMRVRIEGLFGAAAFGDDIDGEM
jgi:hypothetical protein